MKYARDYDRFCAIGNIRCVHRSYGRKSKVFPPFMRAIIVFFLSKITEILCFFFLLCIVDQTFVPFVVVVVIVFALFVAREIPFPFLWWCMFTDTKLDLSKVEIIYPKRGISTTICQSNVFIVSVSAGHVSYMYTLNCLCPCTLYVCVCVPVYFLRYYVSGCELWVLWKIRMLGGMVSERTDWHLEKMITISMYIPVSTMALKTFTKYGKFANSAHLSLHA